MVTSSRANARVTFVVNKRTKTCWSTIELALGVCTRRMPIHMTKMSPPYVLPQHNDGPLSKWQGRSFLLFPSVYVNRHITLLQLVQADVGWVDGYWIVGLQHILCRIVTSIRANYLLPLTTNLNNLFLNFPLIKAVSSKHQTFGLLHQMNAPSFNKKCPLTG